MKIIIDVIPLLFLFFVTCILIRGIYLIKYKLDVNVKEELMNLLFIIYILFLYYLVTYKNINPNWAESNYKLFEEITRYKLFSKMFFSQIIGNVILFIPYGMFICYYLRLKKIYLVIIITLLITISIELIQFKIGRTFDIDDILLNNIGSIIGYFLFIYIEK